MTHSHREAFLAAICERPDDPLPKMIYADWLHEQGDPAWEAWWWLAENEKYPNIKSEGSGTGWYPQYKEWQRFAHATVPHEIFNALPRRSQSITWNGRQSTNYRHFITAFLSARKNGWIPTDSQEAAT